MPKVLVVEDDKMQNQTLADWFTDQDYSVDQAYSCLEAETCLAVSSYDLIVMDWELPDGEGIAIISRCRKKGIMTPVLMLTGKGTLDDKEQGFESGADDYLTKPFQERELAARVKALLRRPATYIADVIRVGDLDIYQSEKVVKRDKVTIPLTPKEFEILSFLSKSPNTVFSAEAILRRVWETDAETTADNIRKYIQRVRAKLESHGCTASISTTHGIGYALQESRQKH